MKNDKIISFEDAILGLEESITKMESGELTLDGSIEEFEKALGYIKLCESKLSAAKDRVRMLTEAKDGTVTDVPFAEE